MLESLFIENVALIRRMELNFSTGFTVLTGETGAGKSIVIDSIALLQGGRADRDLIRSGEDEATVSAVFSDMSASLTAKLDELGAPLDQDGKIVIQRKITSDGRSYSKINGRSVTVGVLGAVGRTMINIYGQHENVALIDSERHIEYLDLYSDNKLEYEAYSAAYSAYIGAKETLSLLKTREKGSARMAELLAYQIKDISAARLKIGEEEALEEREKLLKNAEKISRSAKTICRALVGGDKGAVSSLKTAIAALAALDGIIENVPETIARLTDYRYEIEAVAEEIRGVEVDSENPSAELDRIEGRLDTIAKLEKKYGATIEEVLAFERQAREDLSGIENIDTLMADAEYALRIAEKTAAESAAVLSATRITAAVRFERAMIAELTFLGMGKVKFVVSVEAGELSPNGRDRVEFLISANPGEPPKNLGKIASGGELSRIMLANRAVMATKEGTPSLIFDEIDTGISGKTSESIGIKLREISADAQVFCVTHSAQIAAIASAHYKIAKHEENGRTETNAALLNKSERITELATIFGGANITENTLKTAKEMLARY